MYRAAVLEQLTEDPTGQSEQWDCREEQIECHGAGSPNHVTFQHSVEYFARRAAPAAVGEVLEGPSGALHPARGRSGRGVLGSRVGELGRHGALPQELPLALSAGSSHTSRVRVHQESIEVRTRGRGFTDVTSLVARVLAQSRVTTGLCSVFVQHTSASLILQENADPRVLKDLERWMGELAPEARDWEHDDEGPDDMPAHARSVLTRSSESIPVMAGELALGTWQALYLWEHRRRGHVRRLVVTIQGQ